MKRDTTLKMSDVKRQGLAGAEPTTSEARTQVARYGALMGGRPRRPGRAKPQTHLFEKEETGEMRMARGD